MANDNAPDTLPAPRLQLRWAPSTRQQDYEWECHYELVMPLRKHDIRREVYDDDDGETVREVTEFVVPMKEPSLRGSDSTPCQRGDGTRYCDPPFRDGSHARWDAAALGGLPIYVIAPDGKAFKCEGEQSRAG